MPLQAPKLAVWRVVCPPMALQEASGMSTYRSFSLSFPCLFPIPLGDHEREIRMITFRLSIFCSYETMNFGKIWMFTVVALLSGTPVMAKSLKILVLCQHASCGSQLHVIFSSELKSTTQNSGDLISAGVRQRFYFFTILSVWSCFTESF